MAAPVSLYPLSNLEYAPAEKGRTRTSQTHRGAFSPPDQRDDKLNPAVIETLEQIFAENGVPGSDRPLLPIMPNVRADAPAHK